MNDITVVVYVAILVVLVIDVIINIYFSVQEGILARYMKKYDDLELSFSKDEIDKLRIEIKEENEKTVKRIENVADIMENLNNIQENQDKLLNDIQSKVFTKGGK